MNVTLPIIHMNGTSRKMLQEDYDKADDALDNFTKAFGSIEFNARDYYPGGPGCWEEALEQREEISRKIQDIQSYINAIRTHLHQ